MWLPHDIVRLLGECGFTDAQIFGSVHGERFTLDSRRCIVVARRP